MMLLIIDFHGDWRAASHKQSEHFLLRLQLLLATLIEFLPIHNSNVILTCFFSPPIHNITIPFYFRHLKLSVLSPLPLTARSTMIMWGSTLELRWGHKNVSKMTLDIRHLKMMVRKFRKSMHIRWFHICADMPFGRKLAPLSACQVHSIAHTQRKDRSLWEW